jgi:hypothetical protein
MEEFILKTHRLNGSGYSLYNNHWGKFVDTYKLLFRHVDDYNQCLKKYNAKLKLSDVTGCYDIQFATEEDMIAFALIWG